MWRDILIGIGGALVLSWLALAMALLAVRPKGNLLREALRLLPDLIRLLRNLATDRSLPRGVRVRLGLLMLYLALPIDLIPDFIPVLGYADDAIIVAAVLRSVVRTVGLRPVQDRWAGTADGFAALCLLTGVGPGETDLPRVDLPTGGRRKHHSPKAPEAHRSRQGHPDHVRRDIVCDNGCQPAQLDEGSDDAHRHE